MIWIKRLLPIVVIAVTALAWYLWDSRQSSAQTARQERLAEITAQVWIGTALYRDDPERYVLWRDSLLAATGVTREKLLAYIKAHEAEPEELIPFARRIQADVDSLGHIQDSLFREARIKARDSALSAQPTAGN